MPFHQRRKRSLILCLREGVEERSIALALGTAGGRNAPDVSEDHFQLGMGHSSDPSPDYRSLYRNNGRPIEILRGSTLR
jgi:hypothetical protein